VEEKLYTLTWINCRKIDCYCRYEVEVTEVHLPPSRKTADEFVIECRGTHVEICSVNVAIHCIMCKATLNRSALIGCFPNRCIFYSNKLKVCGLLGEHQPDDGDDVKKLKHNELKFQMLFDNSSTVHR